MKSPFIVGLAFLFFHCTQVLGQENCGSAIPISFGGSVAGDNTGALPDIDYSVSTGCISGLYNSTHWYSFVPGSTTSSAVLTFTPGTIVNATITIVDDCSSAVSFSYLWFDCDANAIAGVPQIICDLVPSQIYYIQISSAAADEGTFTIGLEPNFSAPSNDICQTAIVLFGGELDCGEFAFPTGAPSTACPDFSFGGPCFPVGTPGVWYTFSIPADMPYGSFVINPVPAEFELYSSTSDCSNLSYVDCGGGYLNLEPIPGITYYILAISDLNIGAGWIIENGICVAPETTIDTGNGTGESQWANNSCEPDDSTLPCQNAHVIWYSYTVGCSMADLEIEVEPWFPINGQPIGIADEAGILAMLCDCTTIMSDYDLVNGTGYVCSALVGNETLSLSDVPAGMTILIAVGSGETQSGYYEIVVNETPLTGGITNDLCSGANPIILGINENLNNGCGTQDIPFPNCPPQSEATTWYTYDPSPNIEDITITLDPKTIINPAMAAYDGCASATLLDEVCGTELFIPCVEGPVYIQVGSANLSTGAFSLEVATAPAIEPPPLIVTSGNICSDESADMTITIPGGLVGDIIVNINSSSSADITGMMTHLFSGVNSVTVNDLLVNCGTSTQDAIYTIEAIIPGFTCPTIPIDEVISVPPKLVAIPPSITQCLPFLVNFDATNIVSGGSQPYLTYNWLWNGNTVISVTDMISNYLITESGTITLQVTDAAFCSIETTIIINAHPLLNTFLVSDQTEACPGSSQTITFTVSAIMGGPIDINNWTVLDSQANEVIVGEPMGNELVIETDSISSGVYTVSVESIDQNGCATTSNDISLTIHPIADGMIELITGANCDNELVIMFYGPSGSDIYGNGPDTNGDGIPDILDLDNNGIADIDDIIWTTPPGDVFNTGELTFTPSQGGIYTAEIITDQDCSIIFTIDALLPQQDPPTISSNSMLCLGQEVILNCEPATFDNYSWLDVNGVELGTGPSLTISPTTTPISYTLETIDGNGCMFSVMTALVLNETPNIQLTGSTSICPGENTTVSVGGAIQDSYQWFDAADQQLGSDSSSLIVDMSGNYSVIVTNNSGCADTLDFVIDENADLAIEIAGDDLCGNVMSNLDGGPGFDSYLWLDANGDHLGMGQMLNIDMPGVYVLDVSLGNCTGSDTIEILQAFAPVVDVIESLDLCNNAGTQSMLNFNELAATSDMGFWMSVDLPASVLDDLTAVDFDMVGMGSYTFVYTTNVAIEPCQDIMDTLIVNVSDCPCLNPDVEDQLMLCNDLNLLDLDTALLPTTDPGTWSFEMGPEVVTINGSLATVLGLAPGIYHFAYTLDPLPSSGCQISDLLEVEIVGLPEVVFDPPSSLCNVPSMAAGSTLDLGAVLLVGSGDWIDPNISNLDFTDPNNLNFVGVAPGTYSIEFVTNNAILPCGEVTYTIDITVIDCNCPFIDLQSPGAICNDNASLDLTAYQGISDPGVWSSDPSNPDPVAVSNGAIDLTNATEGTYLFTYTLDNVLPGCPEMDNIAIQLYAPPIITSVEEVEVCNDNSTGGSTVVDLNDLIEADAGVWTDHNGIFVTDPSSVDFAGLGIGNMFVYTYTTTGAIPPCSNAEVTTTITIKDCSCNDPQFLDPPILCNSIGESIDLNDLILSDHQGSWQIINQPDGANATLNQTIFFVEYVVAGEYELEYALLNDPGPNCASTFTFVLTILNQLVAEVNSSGKVCVTNFNEDITSINLSDQVVSSDGPGYWLDENGDVLTDLTLDFLSAQVGDYIFTYVLENSAPCIIHESPFILTAEACSKELIKTDIYIPNVFSPNGDNLNDMFFLQSNIADLMIHNMSIFDRWGERVFHHTDFPVNDPSHGWNGIFKGKEVVPGVYQYLIDAIDAEGLEIKRVGDVTVLK